MASAKQESEWTRTCEIVAMIFNRTRFGGTEAGIDARDINPYRERPPGAGQDIKAAMAGLLAAHPEIRRRKMIRQDDGSWREAVDDAPK